MSIAVIIQFAALVVIAAIGVCVAYAIFEMREVYAEQRSKFVRAIEAVEELQKLQPQFISLLQRVESDGHALQNIALQVEAAVAAMKNSIPSSVTGAADRQTAALESIRDHMDTQEERLARLVENVADSIYSVQAPPPAPALTPQPETKPDNRDYVRRRKEALSNDPQLRFDVLKDWVSTNTLAIGRRASRGWKTTGDLISHIPAYLEPEAEINDHKLLIRTRGYSEEVTVPLDDL